jgi:cation diffusion facilitator CzcD-associated flavoprotein CzcO
VPFTKETLQVTTQTPAHVSGVQAGTTGTPAEEFDIVVVGAGFGGLYALYRFRRLGLRLKGYETGSGPGGTWYWNRYPGARVDLESMVYSYSFDDELQQEWQWPEHFSPQRDLENYANHVADRFGIREQIQFDTTVTQLRFDEQENKWHLLTDRGEHVTARFVVAATGSLNATNVPDFPGAETFRGQWHHTSKWPKEGVDFTGQRVGIIGTGSSGIQAIPVVAQQAKQLTVFQRTANFSIPSRNRPLDPEYELDYKTNYRKYREMMKSTKTAAILLGQQYRSVFDVTAEERERILNEAWQSRNGFRFLATFIDIRTSLAANEVVAEFVRRKIRETVHDPEVAELLCPRTHPLGTKRLCLDSGYYETFNRENVRLVDVRANPIQEITPAGLRTTAAEYELDMLIYATGFDAMTGSMTRMNITGVGGVDLRDKWQHGPTNYLGYSVAGFPNLFMIHGPGSPSVLAQMIMGAEFQVEWLCDLLAHATARDYQRVATTTDWEDSWGREVEAAADATLYKKADSWYLGANIPGKPRVFMVYIGGFDVYCQRSRDVAAAGYQGFVFTRPRD